jgi:nitronate monooxygenase
MSIEHPIALAPMGGAAGGALAVAVSNSGGLGLVGGARGNRGWLERELAIVTARTSKPCALYRSQWAAIVAVEENGPQRWPVWEEL